MRVAIIGTGLIGSSLGLALRRTDLIDVVVGFDRNPDELATAADIGGVDIVAATPEDAAAGADLVVLAVPVTAVTAVAKQLAPVLADGAILTDVASVKGPIVEGLQAAAPAHVHVIGGHPMAGSHEQGAAHASADLFVGATYLLTPTTHTSATAYQRLHSLVAAIGAKPMAVEPSHHDQLVAVVSHLPQLAASTLMNLAAERARSEHAGLLLLAAGGFRDATRVAASQPQLWLDICAENREAIVAVLDEFGGRLQALREAVAGADREGLYRMLDDARGARRSLPGKQTVSGAMIDLVVPIPDRPGVLAQVTRTVGEVGVNIEDFRIEHASEGGRGSLSLAVIGSDAAAAASEALRGAGFEVFQR